MLHGLVIEHVSIHCPETKTKIITLVNLLNRQRQSSEIIKGDVNSCNLRSE